MKFRLIFLLSFMLLLVIIPSVSAGTAQVNSSLTLGGPTYNRLISPCGSLSGVGTAVLYHTNTITVDAAGVYTITGTSSYDGYLFLYLDSFNPASPATNCVTGNDDSIGLNPRISPALSAGQTYIVVFTTFSNGSNGAFTLDFSGPGNICIDCGAVVAPQETTPVDPRTVFSDGRINNLDNAGPIAVFGADDSNGRGLHIYASDGSGLLLVVTSDQIAAVAECPAANTLIVQTGGISFYRLSTCEFQINALTSEPGKVYVMIFSHLFANNGYRSFEEYIGQ